MRNKTDNAIILAAGYSSRFVPLCFNMPKGLLPVKGETLIERQIRQIKEVGVDKIYVITGAYAEKFNFLVEKHGVELIYNKDYATKNNFASIYAAREVLKNSIITSSDLFFPNNIFQNGSEHAYYASVFVEGKTNQRSLTLDADDKIISTHYSGENTWITFGGQAYFTEEISQKLISYMEPVYDNPEFANKYWVDFQDEHLAELPMYIKRLNLGDIVEFNSLDALQEFDTEFEAKSISPVMEYLCNKLNAQERDLKYFEPIKEGNLAIGCTFIYNNKKYEYFSENNILKGYSI